MSSRRRLEKPLTGSIRIAAYSLLILLAFLAMGCQGPRMLAAPASVAAASACGEGLLHGAVTESPYPRVRSASTRRAKK